MKISELDLSLTKEQATATCGGRSDVYIYIPVAGSSA